MLRKSKSRLNFSCILWIDIECNNFCTKVTLFYGRPPEGYYNTMTTLFSLSRELEKLDLFLPGCHITDRLLKDNAPVVCS